METPHIFHCKRAQHDLSEQIGSLTSDAYMSAAVLSVVGEALIRCRVPSDGLP